MGVMEWFGVIMLGICALAVVPQICDFFYRKSSPERDFARSFDDFLEDRRLAGVSMRDALDELTTREFFIQLSEDASDSVLQNPGDWKGELDRAVQRGFDRMAHQGKAHLMPLLAQMLAGHSYSNILYPDACAVVEIETPVVSRRGDYRNLHAALKIVGK